MAIGSSNHSFSSKAHQLDGDAYDIIGDVHGCAESLCTLLDSLGYHFIDGCYRHETRQVIFLGDIIDRGPEIRRCLQLVKPMVDSGAAQIVLGNHELHALIRANLPANIGFNHRMMAETIEQFRAYPQEWQEYLDWFETLPIYLDLGSCRIVHACWDDQLIKQYQNQYPRANVSREFLLEAFESNSFAARFLDRLTRGTVLPLPKGRELQSKDGCIRRFFRTKFWATKPSTYEDVVCQPDPLPNDIASQPLVDSEKHSLLAYDPTWPPVFVGHYWLNGTPEPVRGNVACLDYSAVKEGKLAAYRFDGEQQINKDKFVWVDVVKENLNCIIEEQPFEKK